MTKYAVIRVKGRQYRVSEKEEILVDKAGDNPEADVLLVVDGEKVSIGKPKAIGAKISLKKMEDLKGEKVTVIKFKAKSRYRKKIGFRPSYSRIVIEKINS